MLLQGKHASVVFANVVLRPLARIKQLGKFAMLEIMFANVPTLYLHVVSEKPALPDLVVGELLTIIILFIVKYCFSFYC